MNRRFVCGRGPRALGVALLLLSFMWSDGVAQETATVRGQVTQEGTGEPVTGLQDTVQVEVTFAETGTSRVMDLRALFGQPGRYTADVIPTRPGAYVLRFFGTIDGVEIDETFQPYSMGGGFNDVASSVEIHFPEAMPSMREIGRQPRHLYRSIPSRKRSASSSCLRASRS
jgi:hypothetical protein